MRLKIFCWLLPGLLFLATSPSSARCGLDTYTVEGTIQPPSSGLAISVYPSRSQKLFTASDWLRVGSEWHEVDATTGSFEIETHFDPTSKWRIPFWGDLCNQRPSSVQLAFRREGEEPVYLVKPIERGDIRHRISADTEGPPRHFEIHLGKIQIPEPALSAPPATLQPVQDMGIASPDN